MENAIDVLTSLTLSGNMEYANAFLDISKKIISVLQKIHGLEMTLKVIAMLAHILIVNKKNV